MDLSYASEFGFLSNTAKGSSKPITPQASNIVEFRIQFVKEMEKNEDYQSSVLRKHHENPPDLSNATLAKSVTVGRKTKDILDLIEDLKVYCEYHSRFPVVFNPVNQRNSVSANETAQQNSANTTSPANQNIGTGEQQLQSSDVANHQKSDKQRRSKENRRNQQVKKEEPNTHVVKSHPSSSKNILHEHPESVENNNSGVNPNERAIDQEEDETIIEDHIRRNLRQLQESLNKIKIVFPGDGEMIEPQEFTAQYSGSQRENQQDNSQEEPLFEIPDTLGTTNDSTRWKHGGSKTESSSSEEQVKEKGIKLLKNVDFEEDSLSEKSVEIYIKDASAERRRKRKFN